MRSPAVTIAPMKRAHIRRCNAIVAVSEPWKTLHEWVDFSAYIPLRQAYVCTEGDELAGFIVFTPEPVFARGGYIRAVGVAPGMRRRGIGTLLLAFAEQTISRNCRNAFLCVSSFNRQGQKFYKDQGYIRVGKVPGLILPESSEYIFWKKLKYSKR
jgi:ribosomal protein S18 acetylase RimI-like enzyme